MTYLPEVRDALAALGSRHANERGRPRRRHFERACGYAAVAATVLVSLSIAAIFIADVHHGHVARSTPASRPTVAIPTRWRADHLSAMKLVAHRDRGCSSTLGGRGPAHERILTGRPPHALAARLRIMRTPAPARTRISAAQIGRLEGDPGMGVDAQGIYIRYARQARIDGVRYVLIPVEHLAPNELPRRCFTEQLTAFRDLAAKLPTDQRKPAIQFEATRLRHIQAPQPAGIVLITNGPRSRGVEEFSTGDLDRFLFSDASSGNDTITKTVLLLPDDVATVTARYAQQKYPGRVRKPITITRTVTNNLVILVFHGAFDPPRLTFRTASGHLLSIVGRR